MRVPLLGEERLDQGLQRGNVDGRSLPDGREVDSEVFVGSDVAHALYLAPRDLGCLRLDVLRDVRGGLADDDEGEANGLDGLLVAREIRLLEAGRVAPDPLCRGEDIGDTKRPVPMRHGPPRRGFPGATPAEDRRA